MALAVRYSCAPPAGRLRFDRCVLRVPYFGKLLQKIAVARFARTLSTLLQSGIALLPVARHRQERRRQHACSATPSRTARDTIREGQSIAAPLKKSGLFPPLMVHMIAVGEKSGELEEMLAQAADAYDGEVDSRSPR